MGSAPVKITNITELGSIITQNGTQLEGIRSALTEISREFSQLNRILCSEESFCSTEEGETEEMEIPLKIEKMVGTGLKVGKNTPFLSFLKDMVERAGYSWSNIQQGTVDSDQGITGWKILKLKSFHPGKTYEFTVNVDESFTDIASDENPINIFAISLSDLMFAIDATKTNYLTDCINNGWLKDPVEYIPPFIGNLKAGSWVTRVSREGGTFSLTPNMEPLHIHITAHLPGGQGHQGCVITEFDSTSNTITIGGY